MNLPARDDIHLLAGAYALNALDDLERRRFEAHLPTCASCRDDVASFADATAVLAAGVAITPPDSMRAGVIARVDQTRQLSTRGGTARRPMLRRAAAGIAAASILVLGVIGVRQHGTNQQLAARVAILESGDASASRLAGDVGSVQLISSASHGASVLVADGLVTPPAGRTYELWIIDNGTPQRSATFRTDAKRHAVVKIDRVPPLGSVLAITEEPDGGSDAPTTKPSHVSSPVS